MTAADVGQPAKVKNGIVCHFKSLLLLLLLLLLLHTLAAVAA